MTDPKGSYYEGYFVDGKEHGKGRQYNIFGFQYYEGDFFEGVRQGKGIFYEPEGGGYEGDFYDDWEHGKGKLTIMNDFTKPDGYGLGCVYEGDFFEGVRQGYGIETYNNGVRYEGEFDDCFPNGKGTLIYTDGSSYEGEVDTGLGNGKGTFIYPDGDKLTGEFRDGRPVGEGFFTNIDGETHTHDTDFCGECYERHLKEEGISNDGYTLNSSYMTDEDVIVNIEVKKEITETFEVRVHKDHIHNFDVDEYLSSFDIEQYWENTSPQELIDGSTEYHRVVDTQKVSGDNDLFYNYVCSAGTFIRDIFSPEKETKSVDVVEVKEEEIPKLLN